MCISVEIVRDSVSVMKFKQLLSVIRTEMYRSMYVLLVKERYVYNAMFGLLAIVALRQ